MLCAKIGCNRPSGLFVNCVNVFSLYPYYLLFGKGVAHNLNNLESSLPKDVLSNIWLKLAPWFQKKKDVNVKPLDVVNNENDFNVEDEKDNGQQTHFN